MKRYILMCDVIDSRNKNQQIIINELKNCRDYINEKYKTYILSPLTITLGDEFQAVIKDLETSFNIILEIEEYIIKNNFQIKLRYVLIFGEISTPINSEIAYEMLGEGLTFARNQLNKMKVNENRFFIKIDDDTLETISNNSFSILQNIIDKWKIEKDYKLISNLITYKDYKIVSEKLNKERSLIWKREKSLNMSSYNSIKEIILKLPKYEHLHQNNTGNLY